MLQFLLIFCLPNSLHSNLVLFKSDRKSSGQNPSQLYIPIWFYSNNYPRQHLRNRVVTFTFQSGSIQMTWENKVHVRFEDFTFQSGSIQIGYQPQSTPFRTLYIPIWFYSNRWQRPYTHSHKHPLHSNLVLFKQPREFFLNLSVTIYIPIWFYSNGETFIKKFYICHIYIPIWFYSNPHSFYTAHVFRQFTFQSGSIQIFFTASFKSPITKFTFQSGSIQIDKFCKLTNQD